MKNTIISALLLLSTSSVSFAQTDTSTVLDGSKSLYANTYYWRQVSGKTVSQLATPDSAKCLASGLSEGEYVYELKCTNQIGESKDSVTITVIQSVLSIVIDTFSTRQTPQIQSLKVNSYQTSSGIVTRIESPQRQKIKCAVYDIIGRKIEEEDLQVERGVNLLTVPKPASKGIYLLFFTTEYDRTFINKLIII